MTTLTALPDDLQRLILGFLLELKIMHWKRVGRVWRHTILRNLEHFAVAEPNTESSHTCGHCLDLVNRDYASYNRCRRHYFSLVDLYRRLVDPNHGF